MVRNNYFNIFQSVFQSKHNTETAFIKALNDTHVNSDSSRVSVIALLALFASVKTVDRIILIDRLEISGSALNWFKSYLQDRDYCVSTGNYESERMKITCGVPQGTILGPLLFNIYMLLMAKMMELWMSSVAKWEIRRWILSPTKPPGERHPRK